MCVYSNGSLVLFLLSRELLAVMIYVVFNFSHIAKEGIHHSSHDPLPGYASRVSYHATLDFERCELAVVSTHMHTHTHTHF